MVKKFVSLGLLFVFIAIAFALGSTNDFRHRLQTGAVALAGQDEKVLTKTFEIKGSQSEVSGTSEGSSVTPSFGPTGTVKVRGQGSVNFIPTSSGNGVSFEKGNTQNENTAFYLFKGSDVVNLIDYSAGEINFTLKSKYTFSERNSLPTYYKYRSPFSIEDLGQSDPPAIVFYTEPTQFTFYFRGVNVNKIISQKDFESYFDKDKELKVRLVWGDSVCSVYLNGSLYTSRSCPTNGQISSNSLMSIGAAKPSSYGGGWWANDDVLSDFTISKYITVDKRGPDISSVSVKEDINTASISWQTNEDSTGDVDYGTLLSYGKSVSSQSPSKNHSVSISGLLPATYYNFIIRAKDSAGNISKTTNATFLTKTQNTNNNNNTNNTNTNTNQNQQNNTNTNTQINPIVSNALNKVTIKDVSGQVQSNRVFSISRVFKQGDISNFPQAKINGSVVETQADVKNRWPDGSVKHSIVSFVTSVPANSSVDVEFVNMSGCNCNSKLSADEMLSSKYNLDASMTLSPGGTINAKDMIKSGNFRYWLSGPIVTQVIVEDRTPERSFDLTFGKYKSFHPMFIVSFYPTDSNVKVDFIGENAWVDSLQDIKYSLTLKLDNKTVYSKSDFIHAYSTRWRETFSKIKYPEVSIDHNLAYLVSTKALPNFDTSIKIDEKAIDDGVNKAWNGQCGTPSWVEAVRTGKTDIGGPAQVCISMPAPGGRPDLGVVPGWFVRYLYAMSSSNPLVSKLYDAVIGNADVSGSVRMHYRETKTGKTFSKNSSESAYGRALSIDVRPGYSLIGPQSDAGEGDGINFISQISGRTGVEPQLAHLPSLAYVPYLLTGDYYYLENQFMAASYAIGASAEFDGYRKRNPNIGGIVTRTEYRGYAWALREIGQAAFVSPDDYPEKEYFTRILDRNIAVYEGLYNITNGSFYDSTCSSRTFNRLTEQNAWCYGNKVDSLYGFGSDLDELRFNNPMKLLERGGTAYSITAPQYNTSKVKAVTSPWMWGYNLITWGYLSDMGYKFKDVLSDRLKVYLYLTTSPGALPQMISSYTIATRNGDGKLVQTPKEFVDALDSSEVQRKIQDNYSNASDGQSGYSLIAKAAMSFLPGVNDAGLRGQDAWNLVKNALSRYDQALTYDQTWAIIPRYSEIVQQPVTVEVPKSTTTNPIVDIIGNILAPIIDIVVPKPEVVPPVTAQPTTKPTTNTTTGTNTGTVNTTSLTISSIRATKNNPTEVVVTWNTNLESDSNVEYRYSVGQGKWNYNTVFNASRSTTHSVTLKNLKPDSIYYYKVWSKDKNGKTVYSAERIFNTISQ